MPPFFRFFLNFERIDLSNYELDWLEIFFRGKVHVYISMKKLCGAHSSSQKIRKPLVLFSVRDFPGNVYAPTRGSWGRVPTPVLPKLLFLRFLWYSPDIKNIIFSKNLFSSTKIDKVFFELSRVINYPHSVKPDFFIIFFKKKSQFFSKNPYNSKIYSFFKKSL